MLFNFGYPRDWSTLKKLIWLRGSGASGGLLPWTEFTGNPLQFDSPKAHSLKSCVVTIEPIQSGSGDPSPDNVRPISGWTEAKLWESDEYDTTLDPSLTLPFSQTVYGGTASYNGDGTWTVTVTHKGETYVGAESEAWASRSASYGFYTRIALTDGAVNTEKAISNFLNWKKTSTPASLSNNEFMAGTYLNIRPSADITTVSDWKTYLASNNLQVVYPLATPTSFTITTAELFDALQGRNVMWTDCNNLTVEAKGTAVTP